MDTICSPYGKLVLAFDIGMAYSEVSYALLDPGSVPRIKSISRFLNNRSIGNFKIPSILYYNHDGSFRGVKGTVDDDEAENLHEVRWKSRLSPGQLPANAEIHMAADLPEGKSLQDIFADFIRYLFDSAKYFIQEGEHMGKEIWKTVEWNIDLMLTHPRGWGGQEQEFLRKSVVQASIFTEERSLSHVLFVTEGEAKFYFCVANTKSIELLQGHKVLIVDAGGVTVDVSSYTVNSTSPLEVEEFRRPQCFVQGAEVVTARATDYARSRFENSRFDNNEDLAAFMERFDSGLKMTFSDKSKTQFVKFGSPRDNDERCGVRNGRLYFSGDQVAAFFEPTVNAIVNSIKELAAETNPANTIIFLIGGLGASPWISQEVGREIAAQGLKISCPDTQTSKAVAVGAISHYLSVSRVVEYTYGTLSTIEYDHSDPEHRNRSHKKYLGITGEFHLDIFGPILFKGTRVPGMREFRGKTVGISPLPLVTGQVLKFPLIRYTGTSKNPQWMDEEQGNFETICHISVDVAKVPCIAGVSRLGFPSFMQEFEVIYTYGQTLFEARVSWMEEGVEKRSDPKVLYDVDGNTQEM